MDPEKKEAMNFLKKLKLADIFIGLTILLGIILIINLILTLNINKDLKKASEAVQEKLKPAKIELTSIINPKCPDCFDISAVISGIKGSNANITKESVLEFDSAEGRKIIKKYGLEKIPAIVVTGEIDKVNVNGLRKAQDALLLAGADVPYTNALTEKIEGRVTLYHLKDASCEKCNDMGFLAGQIKRAGVSIYEEKIIDAGSNEGQEIISRYKIGFVPSIVLSKEASAYQVMQQAWPQIGSVESDGSHVLRMVSPPYINLTTGKLRGLVDITYLTDKRCTECYNVSQHKLILANPQGFAMKLDKEENYDASDAKGKELIAKYNITQVPTIILSKEIDVYPSSTGLRQFFSLEEDGSYVFRKLSVVGTYKDLAKNEIVQPQQIEEQGQ
ncbi:hypothetical protein HYT53_06125 [Candidatus Woesearchaeota archaeon]|nr:hypothetical protein [Candidatus Woesearchaeota archaeon]